VLLLEKGWVKLFGSYLKAETCMVNIVFEYLTGAPSVLYYKGGENYWEKNNNRLRNLLRDAYNNDYILACSSAANRTSRQASGIVSNHAYSIL